MGWVYTIVASTGELAMLWGLKKQSTLLMILSWAVGVIISGYFLNRALQLLDRLMDSPSVNIEAFKRVADICDEEEINNKG